MLLFSQAYTDSPAGILRVDPKTRHVEQVPGTESLRWPKCSKQGDVVATSAETSGWRTRVLRNGSNVWEDLGPFILGYPNWTRDGRSYCGEDVVTSHRIQCFSLASRLLVTLAEVPPFPRRGWVGSAWMGLDAEDRPLVVADRSTTALYALDWEAP